MGLIKFIKEAGNSSEQETKRDGVFSYKSETHSFVLGMYDGFKSMRPRKGLSETTKNHPDYEKEKIYARAGYIIGYPSKIPMIYLIIKIGGI